jgi:hypothetical protein
MWTVLTLRFITVISIAPRIRRGHSVMSALGCCRISVAIGIRSHLQRGWTLSLPCRRPRCWLFGAKDLDVFFWKRTRSCWKSYEGIQGTSSRNDSYVHTQEAAIDISTKLDIRAVGLPTHRVVPQRLLSDSDRHTLLRSHDKSESSRGMCPTSCVSRPFLATCS